MFKRIISNWSLLFLLAFNGYLIWYYNQNPSSFKTLVWLYWLQSVMLGFFSTLEIFLATTPRPTAINVEGRQQSMPFKSKGCFGLFFLFHYGLFHLVYAVFLLMQLKGKLVPDVLLLGFALIFIELTLSFIKRRFDEKQSGIGAMIFYPYLRIIPMHLMILGPVFLGWSNVTIFLWLKTFVDILMHLLVNRSLKQNPGVAVS